jgi:hypothetical protein
MELRRLGAERMKQFRLQPGTQQYVDHAAALGMLLLKRADEDRPLLRPSCQHRRWRVDGQARQPVQIPDARLEEEMRVLARVVEQDQIEGFGLRIVDETRDRQPPVMRIADEPFRRRLWLAED